MQCYCDKMTADNASGFAKNLMISYKLKSGLKDQA